ncbi:MAG: hypothetical protein M1831_000978 [Alyxoria varia]|nr:MAG: hypothetical protein M1831_000978 [Alyxoria varia]
MASSRQAVTALLTEHFRYTPLTLIDDIINTVNELVYRAVTAVEDGLTAANPTSLGFTPSQQAATNSPIRQEPGQEPGTPSPHSPQKHTISSAAKSKQAQADKERERELQERQTARDAAVAGREEGEAEEGQQEYSQVRVEIENGVHQLETLLEANLDKNFDRLEIFLLRNVLSVPEELVGWNLDFNAANATLVTPETKSNDQPNPPSASDLVTLRRKLHQTQKLHAALAAESARNKALITQLRRILSPSSASHSSVSQLEKSSSETHQQQAASTRQPNLSFLTNSSSLTALRSSTLQPTDQPRRSSAKTAESQAPLTDSTRTLVKRDLPKLRALLTQLREAQVAGATRRAPARSGTEVERQEYIEGVVGRAVGEVKEEADAGGDGSKPPTVAGARERVGKDEIGAIEGIAARLGSGVATGGGDANDASGRRRTIDKDGDEIMGDG